MGQNNTMYRLYNEMIKGYKENQPALFEHGLRYWMDMDPECPFEKDSEAAELFFEIQMGYTIWVRRGPDMNINRRRMVAAAEKLCELNPKQPYKFDKAEDEEDKRLAKEEEEAKAKKLAEEAKAKKLAEEAKLLEEKKAAEKQVQVKAEKEKDTTHVFGVVEEKEDKGLKLSRFKNLFKR